MSRPKLLPVAAASIQEIKSKENSMLGTALTVLSALGNVAAIGNFLQSLS
ncbi:hypothetical protein [Rhodococcus daqingensis]|uniref:Uncharacterized protein n=1 Tax=Rhodococcus daqingensis TaxID=2479363 RepID=A0ABW2S4D3_9NOCA